jgi:hypothetical protein
VLNEEGSIVNSDLLASKSLEWRSSLPKSWHPFLQMVFCLQPPSSCSVIASSPNSFCWWSKASMMSHLSMIMDRVFMGWQWFCFWQPYRCMDIVPSDQLAVYMAAQERIVWHEKLGGTETTQKQVHELVSVFPWSHETSGKSVR